MNKPKSISPQELERLRAAIRQIKAETAGSYERLSRRGKVVAVRASAIRFARSAIERLEAEGEIESGASSFALRKELEQAIVSVFEEEYDTG